MHAFVYLAIATYVAEERPMQDLEIDAALVGDETDDVVRQVDV